MYTKIIGTGSYLPEQVRTNADLEKMVETSDEWIVTRTGIRERRIAAAHETVATMGFEAAKQALAMAGVSAEQIGLIIVATTSGTHAFPSSACQIQSMLGVKGCPAFDVAAACAGFTYALSVADQYVKNGAVDYALDDTASGRYAIFIKDISSKESEQYVKELKDSGYAELHAGVNAVSLGTMLEGEDAYLSVSYAEGVLGVVITLKEAAKSA